MQTLDILKAIRSHFGISQPDKNGIATFDLSHLLFVLVNDSNVCKELCARDLPARTWRVKVKSSIQAVLKNHIGDSFAALSEVDANHIILLLLRIVNISESLRSAFKIGATLPNLEGWISQFHQMPPDISEFEQELSVASNGLISISQEDMQDIMMIAGSYCARYLPETYRHLVPQVVTQFRALAKLFAVSLDEGVAVQLLMTIETFQAGEAKFKEFLRPLVETIEKNRQLSQFLFGEQPLPRLKEHSYLDAKLPLSADTKQQIKQISLEVKKQAPTLLLKLLYDPVIAPLNVDHDRLAEFVLTYVEKVSRNTEDIELFLEQVCRRFPNLQKSIEGANFLLELAGNTANSTHLCEKRRLAVFKQLNSLFEESMNQHPDIAIIFTTLESCKSTRVISQERLDSLFSIISSHHYSDNCYSATLHQKMIHRLTLAFYFGPEVNLRRLAYANNEPLLQLLIVNAPPESASKLLRRIRNLLPIEVFNQCVLLQHELLNDKYHLFTNRSGNLLTKLVRRTRFGRYLLGDAPGDDFSYGNLICAHPMRRVGFISILLNNPHAREGFFNSSAIAKSDPNYFALFYSQALQMSLNQMNEDDTQNAYEFVNKLLQTPDQKINAAAFQKLWTGLRDVDQSAMRDLSGVVLAVEKNFDPTDPITILGYYLQSDKKIDCQNQDRTGKSIKLNYAVHLPASVNSFDEIFIRILKSRVNEAILQEVSQGGMQQFVQKPEESPFYQKLLKLAVGLFAKAEKHPRFAEILGFLLSCESFKKITLFSPIIQALAQQLKAGDLESWMVVTQNANHVNLKIDYSKPGKKVVYLKCGGSQAIEFELTEPSLELSSLLKEYDVQLHQTSFAREQLDFAKRINRLSSRLDQDSADELIEVLSTTEVKHSTLLTLMTCEKFAVCVHQLNIIQPGVSKLVYDILARIQNSKTDSAHSKVIANTVKVQLDRACEPLEVTSQLASKLNKEDWRQPQATYYVSPGLKNPATFATVNNLHPTELAHQKTTLVV